MAILTSQEREFLDVFLHEATTSPFFRGPATQALYALGVEYRDVSFIAWAYDQDVPRTSFEWGHAAEVAPPLPGQRERRFCAGTRKFNESGNRCARSLVFQETNEMLSRS